MSLHLPLAFELSAIHVVMVLALGLLLFGRRLPEIGKSLGKSVTEFKKGLAGVEDDVNINKAVNTPPAQQQQQPQQLADNTHVTAQVSQNHNANA